MLYKEVEKEEKNPFLDWPKAFYEERDPEKREALIIEKLNNLGQEQKDKALAEKQIEAKRIEEYRLLLLRKRYPLLEKKRGRQVDFFKMIILVWISICLLG